MVEKINEKEIKERISKLERQFFKQHINNKEFSERKEQLMKLL